MRCVRARSSLVRKVPVGLARYLRRRFSVDWGDTLEAAFRLRGIVGALAFLPWSSSASASRLSVTGLTRGPGRAVDFAGLETRFLFGGVGGRRTLERSLSSRNSLTRRFVPAELGLVLLAVGLRDGIWGSDVRPPQPRRDMATQMVRNWRRSDDDESCPCSKGTAPFCQPNVSSKCRRRPLHKCGNCGERSRIPYVESKIWRRPGRCSQGARR
jgi:hypothetical protein